MLRATHSSRKFVRRRRRENQRGVALITTLLLLLLLIGLSLAMTLSAGSDMFINSYYRNFRGSFYAADSGLNIVRQDMVAQILAAVPANFAPNVQPIPAGTEAVVVGNINTTYGGSSYRQLSNSGNAVNSWPEAYKIDPAKTTLTLLKCSADSDTATDQPCAAPTGIVKSYKYIYNYSLTALGQSAKGTEQATLTDSGQLVLQANIVPATSNVSFAGYGMFIDNFDICSGTLVPGLITGPVFTNGAWTFGNSGSYTFTDPVGSVSSQAGYNFGGGTCDQVAGPSDTSKSGKTIAPNFQAGFNMGSSRVPLPTDSYNQQRAVLDSIGTAGQPTSAEMNAKLKDITQTPYPSGGASNGVFLPYQPALDGAGKPLLDPITGKPILNVTGGGILVQGDAAVTLSAVGTSQVYQINQGGTVTTITVTPTPGVPGAGTTVVQTGGPSGTTLTLTGVPVMRDPASGAVTGDATMLYVNGSITSLSGTAEGAPAIADGSQVTVTAGKNITVTGDILYKSQPIDMPGDTINKTGDTRQALGIYTANGDVILNNQQADKTLTINASIATLAQGGSGGIVNNGAAIDTLTIVGGRIQNNIKNINTTTRNVFFDRRFGGNFFPPWFPSAVINIGKSSAQMQPPNVIRSQWLNNTSTY